MKYLKSTSNTEKKWQGIVYKMKEAEQESKQLTSFEEKIHFILKEGNTSASHKKTTSTKKAAK